MPDPIIHRAAAKMQIAKVSSGEELEAQYNPTELEEEVSVNWGRLRVLGSSFEQLQYGGTNNHVFSFDMAFSAFDDRGNQANNIQRSRRFLLSCCYRKRGAQDIAGGAPSRVLFVWPKLASLTCVVTKVKIKHTDFAQDGLPIRFVASVSLEEIRDLQLYEEDVLASGTQRS